jgi:hypothetical protein
MAAEEIPSRLLCNTSVHCRVHKNSPLAHILSQLNPVHTLKSFVFKIISEPAFNWGID